MKTIIILILHSLFITKGLCLTSVDSIDEEYRTVVNETAFKILHALTNVSEKIALALDEINYDVSTSQDSVLKELAELHQYVSETVAEAEEDELDIENCTLTTFDGINNTVVENSFGSCKRHGRFLMMQKYYLGKLSAAFPVEVNFCIMQEKKFGYDLDECLDFKVQQVNKRIDQIYETVERMIKSARERSFRCASAQLERLDRLINRNQHEFDECAKSILDLDY